MNRSQLLCTPVCGRREQGRVRIQALGARAVRSQGVVGMGSGAAKGQELNGPVPRSYWRRLSRSQDQRTLDQL